MAAPRARGGASTLPDYRRRWGGASRARGHGILPHEAIRSRDQRGEEGVVTEASDERTIERRSTAREPIHRRVVFSGVRGEGMLRQGVALDISADGLLIHTTQPDVIGRHLEIELHSGDAVAPGHISMVRARWPGCARCLKEPLRDGVRFLQAARPPKTPAPAFTSRGGRSPPGLRRKFAGAGQAGRVSSLN